MRIKCVAARDFISMIHGNVNKGQIVSVAKGIVAGMVEQGFLLPPEDVETVASVVEPEEPLLPPADAAEEAPADAPAETRKAGKRGSKLLT